jgi:hypothetical protein
MKLEIPAEDDWPSLGGQVCQKGQGSRGARWDGSKVRESLWEVLMRGGRLFIPAR